MGREKIVKDVIGVWLQKLAIRHDYAAYDPHGVEARDVQVRGQPGPRNMFQASPGYIVGPVDK